MEAKPSDFYLEPLEDESVENICGSVERIVALLAIIEKELGYTGDDPFNNRVFEDYSYWCSVMETFWAEYEKRSPSFRANKGEGTWKNGN